MLRSSRYVYVDVWERESKLSVMQKSYTKILPSILSDQKWVTYRDTGVSKKREPHNINKDPQ